MPQMHPVESSWVAAIGYDEVGEELFVALIEGRLYAYAGVPGSVWRDFVAADSKGTFVNETLRPRYPFRRA
jgi:hypothetical protein